MFFLIKLVNLLVAIVIIFGSNLEMAHASDHYHQNITEPPPFTTLSERKKLQVTCDI